MGTVSEIGRSVAADPLQHRKTWQCAGQYQSRRRQGPGHTMDLVKENLETYKDVGQSVKVAAGSGPRHPGYDTGINSEDLQIILDNIKQGSTIVPKISTTFKDGIEEIREWVSKRSTVWWIPCSKAR
jgi:hypothetical protein